MKTKVMVRPDKEVEEGPWESHGINGPFLKGQYLSMRQEVMNNTRDEIFWTKCSVEPLKLIVVFVQRFSDETATTVKSTGLTV